VAVIAVLLILMGAGLTVYLKTDKSSRRLGKKDLTKISDESRSFTVEAESAQKGRPSVDTISSEDGGQDRDAGSRDKKEEVVFEPQQQNAAGVESATRFRLKDRLTKTGGILSSPFALLRSKGRFDQQVYDQLEESLIMADVGLATTARLLDSLKSAVAKGQLSAGEDELADIALVGNYGLKVVWGDGHDTGIYRFELLRGLGQPAPR
jgi:fused signal recognition particle receptor